MSANSKPQRNIPREGSEILGGPAEGGPGGESWPKSAWPDQDRAGHPKSARPRPKSAKARREAKVGPNRFHPTKNGPNRSVEGCRQNWKGRGQTRSWPAGGRGERGGQLITLPQLALLRKKVKENWTEQHRLPPLPNKVRNQTRDSRSSRSWSRKQKPPRKSGRRGVVSHHQ